MSTDTYKRYQITVDTGDRERIDTVIVAPLGLRSSDTVTLYEQNGSSAAIPAQLDLSGHLIWVMSDSTLPHTTRRYVAEITPQKSSIETVQVAIHPCIIVVSVGGRLVTHYNYTSVWKPYFCPLMGPVGNVVRGASAEHQHQAGLFFSYGGHFTPTNIWSDWDEPIYGPCGKMLHTSFESVMGGPLFALVAQRVAYLAADGSCLLDERREFRIFPLPGGETIVDFVRSCPRPSERSNGPFNLSCRVADSLRTVDMSRRGPPPERRMLPTENPGKMEGSEGEVGPDGNLKSIHWLDRSGQLANGWGGLAFFDHPGNPGFPGRLGAAGYGTMGLGYDFPDGQPTATWRGRVFTHAGDAEIARVATRWLDYSSPPQVAVEPLD